MATKSISKSIRLSDDVYGYIMAAPGKGFNEKFENIILEAHEAEPELKKRLAELQKSVDDEQRKLYQLFEKYRYLNDYFQVAMSMQRQLDRMQNDLKMVIDDGKLKE